ncbi:MAG: DUF763 domain-containing protein, partial [Actinomycetota bacterium]|nr:DUF763 domain-containing protein [Actinomycetota bacterium]
MKTGITNLPLHGGKAPYWLFEKMERLSREIMLFISSEFGPEEFLNKISDPFWFQALGCVLGFDWHSSGVTTTVCGALKEAARGLENDLGFYIAGGKGGTSRKTPAEIEAASDKEGSDFSNLVYASKIVAKVDSSVLQDGYQLYHHSFFFTKNGKKWAVVQQGMNEETKYARRYQWLSDKVYNFVCEPHNAISCNSTSEVLDLTSTDSTKARKTITEISSEKPEKTIEDLLKINSYTKNHSTYPKRHDIKISDIEVKRLSKIFESTYEKKPENFEKLISMPGVGPKTVRSLALISELIYSV